MIEKKSIDPLSEGIVSPQMKPACPHCSAEPVPIAANLISLEGAMAVVFFCGVCKKVLSVSALPDAPKPRQQAPSGLIVRPQ